MTRMGYVPISNGNQDVREAIHRQLIIGRFHDVPEERLKYLVKEEFPQSKPTRAWFEEHKGQVRDEVVTKITRFYASAARQSGNVPSSFSGEERKILIDRSLALLSPVHPLQRIVKGQHTYVMQVNEMLPSSHSPLELVRATDTFAVKLGMDRMDNGYCVFADTPALDRLTAIDDLCDKMQAYMRLVDRSRTAERVRARVEPSLFSPDPKEKADAERELQHVGIQALNPRLLIAHAADTWSRYEEQARVRGMKSLPLHKRVVEAWKMAYGLNAAITEVLPRTTGHEDRRVHAAGVVLARVAWGAAAALASNARRYAYVHVVYENPSEDPTLIPVQLELEEKAGRYLLSPAFGEFHDRPGPGDLGIFDGVWSITARAEAKDKAVWAPGAVRKLPLDEREQHGHILPRPWEKDTPRHLLTLALLARMGDRWHQDLLAVNRLLADKRPVDWSGVLGAPGQASIVYSLPTRPEV
jgi:hypothetical protein